MPTQRQHPGIESRLDSHHPAMNHPLAATGALNGPSHDEGADSVTPKPTDHSIPPSDSAVAEKPSDPDSQSSLASSSVVQKPFPRLQLSSSDISQSTYGEVLERDMTPPSSSSAFSSQEQPSQHLKYASLEPYRPAVDETMSDDVETRSEATPVEKDVPMDRRESVQSSRSGSSVELAPGQKRTASGAVKSDNAPKAWSPGKSREAAHVRTISSDSSGSKMAELSSQLRTRLSYAMVKVQHGWQAHSLGEVETLASQHMSSPTTTSTTFSARRPPFTSPRTEIAASLRRQWSGSSDETTHPHPPKHLNGIVQPSPRPVTSPYTSAMQAQEPYLLKSSPNATPRSSQVYHASQKPYLAPPVDIVSGSRRRPAQIATNIPTSNPQSYPTVIPATPPLNPQAVLSAKQRTPSQNRAMEQDAIETLLFMSSPGNSGHRPNMTEISSTLTSPMQSQFSMTERRVGFADGVIDSSSEEGRKKRLSKASGLSRQVDDLDTILDEMEDDGSSDEDEQVLPLHDTHTNGTNGNPQRSSGGGRLQNKVAIVTGSSSGLGRAIALAFAAEGAKVVCSDMVESSKVPPPNHDAINALTPSTNAIFVQTDVGDSPSVENVVRAAVSHHGRLDIIVNNAGIGAEADHPRPLRIHGTPDDRTVRINSRGVWLGCKHATAQMLAQEPHHPSGDRGCIINTASTLGLVGFPGTSSYCAAKGAVVQITRQVAVGYAQDRIHCNALNPGFTRTPMIENFVADEEANAYIEGLHPWPRLGRPEDIAGAAVFLASGDASWVTGVNLPVDGGYTAQ